MSPRPVLASPSPAEKNARSAIALGAALALLCVAVFGVGTPESFAANGLFGALFGGGSPAGVPTLPYDGYLPGPGAGRSHHANHRRHGRHTNRKYHPRFAQAHRHVTERRRLGVAAHAPATGRRAGGVETISFAGISGAAPAKTAASRRTVCVRGCDGYFFPIGGSGRASEISVQQASCEKLCPNAEVKLFVMAAGSDRIEDARAARGGETYAKLAGRLNPPEARSKSCACQSRVGELDVTGTFLADPTLRPGDTVITPQGVRVLRRGSHYPFKQTDFLALAETRDVPLSNRSALYAIERALMTPQGRLAVMNNDYRHTHRRDIRL